jgi:hypothetical protein
MAGTHPDLAALMLGDSQVEWVAGFDSFLRSGTRRIWHDMRRQKAFDGCFGHAADLHAMACPTTLEHPAPA